MSRGILIAGTSRRRRLLTNRTTTLAILNNQSWMKNTTSAVPWVSLIYANEARSRRLSCSAPA